MQPSIVAIVAFLLHYTVCKSNAYQSVLATGIARSPFSLARNLFSTGRRRGSWKSKFSRDDSLPSIDWEVYIDQSKPSLDRGASATLDAFVCLAGANVQIKPALFPKMKLKGPFVRCLAVNRNPKRSFDVSNVDSVDKVFRILSTHMGETISTEACDCLKWKYKGNSHLESGEVDMAIMAYNRALETGVAIQEGIVLLMRATAYMQRAARHKQELKEIVQELLGIVPSMYTLRFMYDVAMRQPILANALFRKIVLDTEKQDEQYRKMQFRHGLYQYALLEAAQDALRATQLLPNYTESWIRAAEILTELWKLNESSQYYERAIELDPSLSSKITPLIKRLGVRQELLDSARVFGWSDEILRLALDAVR